MHHPSDSFISFQLETARLMANADTLDAGLERDLDRAAQVTEPCADGCGEPACETCPTCEAEFCEFCLYQHDCPGVAG